MAELVIFDTSIVIDQIRANRHLDRMLKVNGLVRNSSVVLAELWRGVTQAAEQRFLRTLERTHPILTPTGNNWIESGKILAKMQKDKGFGAEELRDLHFDVLIALTARSHGARLITSNRADFELIRKYRDFKLEVW
jgi:predicted nucleic acid-binding protein